MSDYKYELPLTLPEELYDTARKVAFKWPDCNESMFGLYAEKWLSFAKGCTDVHELPESQITTAEEKNEGAFIDAFADFWDFRAVAHAKTSSNACLRIAGMLSYAGVLLLSEKKVALESLKELHDFLDRYTWAWVPFSDFGEKAEKQNNEKIDSVRAYLAELSDHVHQELGYISRAIGESQQVLGQTAAQVKIDTDKITKSL
ncbi:hypothetical protein [Sphaerisporangium corydalis]|uniref:Uncharacterized protein n=1 Tax=Sphaerisporangium corydalis TaxID=1441875 RepID=A0ABV9EJ34_9ACTN|nr:hypothetical protein [Sphaerisporangium corydalis]